MFHSEKSEIHANLHRMKLRRRNLLPCNCYSLNGIFRISVHFMYVLLISHLPRNMEGEVTFQLPEDTSGFGGKVSHKRVYQRKNISTSCYITLLLSHWFQPIIFLVTDVWLPPHFRRPNCFNRLLSPKHVQSGKLYFVIQVLTDIYS